MIVVLALAGLVLAALISVVAYEVLAYRVKGRKIPDAAPVRGSKETT